MLSRKLSRDTEKLSIYQIDGQVYTKHTYTRARTRTHSHTHTPNFSNVMLGMLQGRPHTQHPPVTHTHNLLPHLQALLPVPHPGLPLFAGHND